MKNLARIGCLARSLVYFLVGVLALLVAMGSEYGATTDESGVLRRIVERPYGGILIFALSMGLFCYALWRFFQSVQDHDGYGHSASGIFVRTALFFSGLAHAFLGISALNLLFRFTKRTAIGEKVMAKWMMMQPFGRFALWILGFAIVVTGFAQFVRAFNGSFARDLRLPERHTKFLMAVCRFGLISRGIIFAIIGTFFMQAAWKYSSREVGGLHKAWETLRLQPYGNFLVAIVAIGFMAFAIFGLIEGFYRKRTV